MNGLRSPALLLARPLASRRRQVVLRATPAVTGLPNRRSDASVDLPARLDRYHPPSSLPEHDDQASNADPGRRSRPRVRLVTFRGARSSGAELTAELRLDRTGRMSGLA